MSKTASLFIFAAGAAIGSAVTYFLTRKKYERLIQEEIDSVKAAYGGTPKRRPGAASRPREKADRKEYAGKAAAYARYSGRSKGEVKKEMEKNMADKPYVITPDEFGELTEYDTISLTYYADEVLADDTDEEVEEIEKTIGFDALNRFGEYEDDVVFVRNDARKADYEIARDNRTYESIVGHNVYGVRREGK